MMGVVPVGDSVVRGYTFLFARFFTVVGLGWLSAAFYGTACSWLLRAVSTGALGAPPSSGAFNQYSLGYLVAMLVVTAFFSAPMLIPFTREALGMHEEAVAAHFSYGPREWRLFVALLRFFGLVGGALFVLIVGSGIAISQFAPTKEAWFGVAAASWLNLAALATVLSTGAFLSVRLGFFLAPIAAVEGHASLARAWTLSRRNFWRLAAIFLSVAIPTLLVVLICEYALWGSDLGAAVQATGSDALAIFKLQYDHSVSIAVMLALALMAVNALLAAASAAAYRALEAEEGETAASAPESDWGIHRVPAFADAGARNEPEAYQPVEPQVGQPQLQMEVPEAVSEEAAEEPVAEEVRQAPMNGETPMSPEVPAELPADEGHAAQAEPVDAEIAKSDNAAEMPPLDPAGLAQALKERETV